MVLLAKITAKEAETRLNPVVSTKSAEETKALRHLRIGEKMENMGVFDKAEEEYELAMESFELAEAHFRLGLVNIELGDLDEAEKHIKRGMEIESDSIDATLSLIKLKLAKDDLDGLKEELVGLSFRSPRNHRIHRTLAMFYEAKGNFKNAVKEYKKAYKLIKKELANQ